MSARVLHMLPFDEPEDADLTPGRPYVAPCGARDEIPVPDGDGSSLPFCHGCVHELMGRYEDLLIFAGSMEARLRNVFTIADPDNCIHEISVQHHPVQDGHVDYDDHDHEGD